MVSAITFEHQEVKLTDITLHIVTAGNPTNPTFILLHGFPEFWKGWQNVAEILAQDYHVVIPDQRGYNTSSIPFWIGDYTMATLAKDIRELIDWTGKSKVHIGGHDWGAAVTWAVISTYPDIIDRAVIVNVPHPKIMQKYMKSSLSQLRKSWYIFIFQIPLLPQIILRLFNFKLLKNSLVNTSLPGTFTQEDLNQYIKAWRSSGVTPMLNWYRAAARRRSGINFGMIDLPILVIWGRQDNFLSEEMALSSLEYCNNGRVEYINEATHWVLHEFPDKVATLMSDFVTSSKT